MLIIMKLIINNNNFKTIFHNKMINFSKIMISNNQKIKKIVFKMKIFKNFKTNFNKINKMSKKQVTLQIYLNLNKKAQVNKIISKNLYIYKVQEK